MYEFYIEHAKFNHLTDFERGQMSVLGMVMNEEQKTYKLLMEQYIHRMNIPSDEKLYETIIKGLFSDVSTPETKYIADRYEFWKTQKNEQGKLYDFTTSIYKARLDFLREYLKQVIIKNTKKKTDNCSHKERLEKWKKKRDENFTTVKCQSCNKNDVVVEKNGVYFGIICEECRKRSEGWPTIKSGNDEKTYY